MIDTTTSISLFSLKVIQRRKNVTKYRWQQILQKGQQDTKDTEKFGFNFEMRVKKWLRDEYLNRSVLLGPGADSFHGPGDLREPHFDRLMETQVVKES